MSIAVLMVFGTKKMGMTGKQLFVKHVKNVQLDRKLQKIRMTMMKTGLVRLVLQATFKRKMIIKMQAARPALLASSQLLEPVLARSAPLTSIPKQEQVLANIIQFAPKALIYQEQVLQLKEYAKPALLILIKIKIIIGRQVVRISLLVTQDRKYLLIQRLQKELVVNVLKELSRT